MGTVYRTDCGCIASRPEPSPAEYESLHDYEQAHSAWQDDWDRVAADHTVRCPSSAYCSDTLLTYDRVKERSKEAAR